MNSIHKVLAAIADRECKRVSRQTIRRLQEMDAANVSDLENAWNEVCVQFQGTQSIFWDMYMETIRATIWGLVAPLSQDVKQAIWLQTESGKEWESESEDTEMIPFSEHDIVEYVLDQYVLPAAGAWTNDRIRQFLDA